MKPRVTVITLGVDDLEASLRFYRDGLGLTTEGIVGTEFEHGAVAFFNLEPGVILALWPRADIAFDTGLAQGAVSSTEFTLANNVSSREEVDATLAEAARAGARIVKPAGDTFYGGYPGYFPAPDGPLWGGARDPGPALPRRSCDT